MNENINKANTLKGAAAGPGAAMQIIETGDTVDNSNTDFDFVTKPKMIVVNGANYREGAGWSWSGTTATLDSPVGTGGDIYGLI